MNKELEKIAEDVLKIKTLETRNSDGLDFYDLSVWSIKDALEEAYKAGTQAKEAEII